MMMMMKYLILLLQRTSYLTTDHYALNLNVHPPVLTVVMFMNNISYWWLLCSNIYDIFIYQISHILLHWFISFSH